MTRDLAALAVANAFVVAAGLGVLRAAGLRPALTDLPWTLGIGYILGAAAVGILGSALLVVGLALSWWEILLLSGGVFAAGFLRRDGHRRPRRITTSGWMRVLPAGAFLVGAILAVDFAVQPLWTDDAWSIWAGKANSIVVLGGLDARFLSSQSLVSPDYPLLVPVLELLPLRFGGSPSELIPLQLGLMFLAFPAALVALLRERVPALALWLVALVILLAPALQIQAASAVADVTLAVFFALAGIAGWRWVESGERAMLWLGGCFAAGAVATKLEGRAFVAFLFLALGAAGVRRSRPLRDLLLVALAVLASAAPWEIWSRVHGLGNAYSEAGGVHAADLLNTVDRVPRAALSIAREAADPSSWIALVLVAAVSILFALRRDHLRGAAVFTAFVSLASLAFLVAVYWATPLDYDYHVATSVRRVVTAPLVFAAAMAPLLLSGGTRSQTAR
jgi:hypothetical protein